MSKPTPGPWFVDRFGLDIDEIMILSSAAKDDDGEPLPVADLYQGGYDHSDKGFSLEANARLIAAAPELLAALEDARAELDISTLEHEKDSTPYIALKEAIAKIDAVISKATGAP